MAVSSKEQQQQQQQQHERPALHATEIQLDDAKLEPVETDEEKKMPVVHEGPIIEQAWLAVLLVSSKRYCEHSDAQPPNPNCGCADNRISFHDMLTSEEGKMPQGWPTRWSQAIPHITQVCFEDSELSLLNIREYNVARVTVGIALRAKLQPLYMNGVFAHDVQTTLTIRVPEAKENGPNGDKTWTLDNGVRINATVEDNAYVEFGMRLGSVEFDGVQWSAISLGQNPVTDTINVGIHHASIHTDHVLGRHDRPNRPHLTCPDCVTAPVADLNMQLRELVRDNCSRHLDVLNRRPWTSLTDEEKRKCQVLQRRSRGLPGDAELWLIMAEAHAPLQQFLSVEEHPLCRPNNKGRKDDQNQRKN
jgi:hypothetical protein